MPNTLNPDVNTPPANDNSESDIERENDSNSENQETPVPPDSRSNAPVEEPPDTQKPAISDETGKPTRYV